MKRGKFTITITIGIMCFILTAVIFIQVKTINQTNITELELMRESELKAEISSTKAKTNEIETKLLETNNKIAEYQEAINKGKEASEILEAELQESENILGKTEVTGEGIIITLSSKDKQVTPDDLLELVNELRDAGAEAISINDRRVIYKSYIVYFNGTEYIKMDGDRILEPYVVKVIGNTTHLESAVAQKKYGYIDKKIAEGKNVFLEKQESVTVNPYNGKLDFEYVKEEEE